MKKNKKLFCLAFLCVVFTNAVHGQKSFFNVNDYCYGHVLNNMFCTIKIKNPFSYTKYENYSWGKPNVSVGLKNKRNIRKVSKKSPGPFLSVNQSTKNDLLWQSTGTNIFPLNNNYSLSIGTSIPVAKFNVLGSSWLNGATMMTGGFNSINSDLQIISDTNYLGTGKKVLLFSKINGSYSSGTFDCYLTGYYEVAMVPQAGLIYNKFVGGKEIMSKGFFVYPGYAEMYSSSYSKGIGLTIGDSINFFSPLATMSMDTAGKHVMMHTQLWIGSRNESTSYYSFPKRKGITGDVMLLKSDSLYFTTPNWYSYSDSCSLLLTQNKAAKSFINRLVPHASFSDTTTQTISNSAKAYTMKFSTMEDTLGIYNIGDSLFYVRTTGDYEVTISAMANATDNNRHIGFWVEKNGNIVDRSGVNAYIANSNNSVQVSKTIILKMSIGQYFKIKYSGDSNTVRWLFTAKGSSPIKPSCPSATLTIKKISD